ncbi:hypothetical protein E3N88_15909 [Mikania micrantha]|uniref:Uncharacterized protein n=1 Tax=Mikania micrantha TaxID=192012 RepID=A0A5N6NWY1_9ASTR|nr:hypothetical protein E3N88_15909 [Mikania micrantha]
MPQPCMQAVKSRRGILRIFVSQTRYFGNFLIGGCSMMMCDRHNNKDAIICPCNVVCLSEDNRNPQPSDEQRKAADFVFYRTFDVQSYAVLDKMDDEVGGLESIFTHSNFGFLNLVCFSFSQDRTPTGSDKFNDQPFKKFRSDKKPLVNVNNPKVSKFCGTTEDQKNRMVAEKVTSDKRLKKRRDDGSFDQPFKEFRPDKKPLINVNNPKASEYCGTTENQKKSIVTAKVTSYDLEGSKLKKRDDGSFKVPDNKMGINMNLRDMVALAKEKSKSRIYLDIHGNKNNHNNKEDKEEESGECIKKLSLNTSLKLYALSSGIDKKNAYQEFVVSPTPNAVSKNPWEYRLRKAYDQGAAILLLNVDPEYNSGEVEDIIWHAFKEKCDAKILQHNLVSNPHYAQALLLLETKEAAHKVLTKLDKGCLMLSNGSQIFMPLVGTPCPPISTKKNSKFFGHLTFDKARFKNQHEDEAVSTSHYPQPNTIEYDLAMEWCLLQLKSAIWWEKFHEEKGKQYSTILSQPRLLWDEQIRQDLTELHLFEDMIYDRST